MRFGKFLPAALFILAVCPHGASAQANGPRTDDVTATFGISMTAKSQERTCVGEDGTYLEFLQEHTGPISSSEPSLNGILTTHTFILVNQTTGLGTAHGTFQVRDSLTNQLKTTARFNGALGAGMRFKGLADGEAVGVGKLTAAISIVFGVAAAVGDMGSPAAVVLSDLGVIQKGSCSGGFGSP